MAGFSESAFSQDCFSIIAFGFGIQPEPVVVPPPIVPISAGLSGSQSAGLGITGNQSFGGGISACQSFGGGMSGRGSL